MAERWSNLEFGPILKPSETLTPTHKAYDNHVESASPEDLGRLSKSYISCTIGLYRLNRIFKSILIPIEVSILIGISHSVCAIRNLTSR